MHYGYFDDENRECVIERPDVPVLLQPPSGRKIVVNSAYGLAFTARHNPTEDR